MLRKFIGGDYFFIWKKKTAMASSVYLGFIHNTFHGRVNWFLLLVHFFIMSKFYVFVLRLRVCTV